MALDLGYIAGYTRCVDVESIKNALIKQMLIQTGSNKIDWKLTWKNNNIAVPGESYGHAFMLEGYDDSLHG
jgi:C1A family cysteine protease